MSKNYIVCYDGFSSPKNIPACSLMAAAIIFARMCEGTIRLSRTRFIFTFMFMAKTISTDMSAGTVRWFHTWSVLTKPSMFYTFCIAFGYGIIQFGTVV